MDVALDNNIGSRLDRRPVITPDDDEFLRELYAAVRDDLRNIFDDGVQFEQLLLLQYRGQALTYAHQFPNASHEIVLLDGAPVGRIILDREDPQFIRLVDVSLLEVVRGFGIGSALLQCVFEESVERDVPVVLHVLKSNRARGLYERLGFQVESADETRLFMKWRRHDTRVRH